MEDRVIIIGAGPTGLGSAYRLSELGYKNWAIYEKNRYLGGHATSIVDRKGFTWDEGVHVLYSKYEYFNRLVEKLLKDDYIEHGRDSWIVKGGRWIPYPFQNHLHHLPKEALLECLTGLLDVYKKGNLGHAANFKEWILQAFGEGIANEFMLPYNSKIWAYPLELMDTNWIAERVSVIDFKRVLKNIILGLDDKDWGPNRTFKFPRFGGTGEIYRRFDPYLRGHLNYGKELVAVNLASRCVEFADGSLDSFSFLINTSPLDQLIDKISDVDPEVQLKRHELKHNSMVVIGTGLAKGCEDGKSWAYFPELHVPFHRITFFSSYSPHNVPDGDTNRYSSIMCEISYSEYKHKRDKEQLVQETINGLINEGILSEGDKGLIISTHVADIEYAYPIPTVDRDRSLNAIQSFLEYHNIYSRGRFGAWKYEIGNMDHSLMQGVEVVDRLLTGSRETVWQTGVR